MYLRTQNEEIVIDLEKCTSVVAEEGSVYFNIDNGTSFLGGTYRNQERAKEVIGEIYAVIDVTSRYDMPVV